ADQRRHSRHLLCPRVPGRERLARPLLEPGRNPDAPYCVVADPATFVGAGEGLAASSAAGSTTKDTLIAGRGRAGSVAADGSRTAHRSAATSQRRQEPPTHTQRPWFVAPAGRRRADPAAPSRRYSRGPGRRTD